MLQCHSNCGRLIHYTPLGATLLKYSVYTFGKVRILAFQKNIYGVKPSYFLVHFWKPNLRYWPLGVLRQIYAIGFQGLKKLLQK